MKKIIIIISMLSFIFTSCEDVIDVDLNSIEPNIVVEGAINDIDNHCIIKLSLTKDYFDESECVKVSGAEVSIIVNNQEKLTLTEQEEGLYITKNFKAIENTPYKLKIVTGEKEYNADVIMPQKVEIDSLDFVYSPKSIFSDAGYSINCYFKEPAEYSNYYRMIAYNIDDIEKGNGINFIFNDKYMNGNEERVPWNYNVFNIGDTVVTELQSIDKSTYNFFKTLSRISEDGGGGTTPANPETNLTNNAFGYFGAYTISRDTIIIAP